MPKSFSGHRPAQRGPTSAFAQSPVLAHAEPAVFYDLAPDFGSYFKSLRTGHGFSVRGVAAELGVAFGYIQRLEAGKWASRPNLQLLEKMAALFGVPAAEVETRAGVRHTMLPDLDGIAQAQFKTLVMHPNWRAPGMTEEWLESFSVKQKRQIVQMLRQVGEQMKAGGASPNEVLAEAGLLTPGPA